MARTTTNARGSSAVVRAGPTRHSEGLFRAAADQAPHVIWIVNAKGAVTYLNRAWYELVGGMPPKWYGHEWMDVVDPADAQEMRRNWARVSVTGAVFEGTRRVRAADGQWHTLVFKASPVFDESGLRCWVGMDSDITELVATQAALETANRELEAFSYTVSHDLRAPLISIEGFTRLLDEEVGSAASARARGYFTRIRSAAKRMAALVDGLLALSRIAHDELQAECVDLSAIALDLLHELQTKEPARQVAVSVQPGIRVLADPRLAASMLGNLLGNAWKFTSATAGAAVSVRMLSQTAGEVVVCVEDNGPGFESVDASRLFSPFERLHGDRFPGTGIGLATVRRIVARHGGRVWAESEPGRGARFCVGLPRPQGLAAPLKRIS
jgi:PAS domain S-box-containing protein